MKNKLPAKSVARDPAMVRYGKSSSSSKPKQFRWSSVDPEDEKLDEVSDYMLQLAKKQSLKDSYQPTLEDLRLEM